eukprot:TRINITY_DN10318_c0_g1_i1.p1 TRINITY_DN10318_c0_g1~~TRINITY_DN10318_c0_g1_i1.p1  ORF type:complete len:454 (-),score=91.97 TRINITY_DN10318_c0_g1_i1:88-1449(-)
MASLPLSKQQVAAITPQEVHQILKRRLLVDGFDVVYDLEKSSGAYLFDSKTNKTYLDFFSFFASWPISHNHPRMNDPSVKQVISKVALHNPANSDIYTVEMAQFVATFERVAMPKEFKHLFLVQGGGLAVENALKTAFDWKVRKNIQKGLGERGSQVLHFKEAFHGRTGYTLSLTNTSDPRKYMYFPLHPWPRVENPKAHFPLTGENLQQTIAAEERSIAQITEILTKSHPDIAALILEPVQGEGGDNHFRPQFWQKLRALCDKFDVIFIADEVQSGMGLTGKFWAYEHYGASPDIVCFGKKSQVCGIMATDRIDQVEDNVFKVSSRINSTWGGNLVDMVRSRYFLEIIEEEKLVQNAEVVGGYLLAALEGLAKKYPLQISNVRGKGLMCAFDSQSPAHCSSIISRAYEHGVIILSCGTQSIRFRPFLDLKKKDVDRLIEVLDQIFAVGNSKL